MTLVPTRAILDRTTRGRAAFNVVHIETAEALAGAADDTGLPLILQISENCVDYHGALAPVAAAVSAIARDADVPIAVHLDHAVSEALALEAIDFGFGSVMFDGATLPFAENVAATRRIVRVAHAAGVLVEAELGEIGGKDGAHAPGVRTDPVEAVQFATATGVDALAVAVGSSHAMTDRTAVLDLDLIARLREAVDIPLVLHGSSGVGDGHLRAAVAAGIAKVNIATQLTKQYTQAVRRALADRPALVDSRTYTRAGRDAVRAEAARLLTLLDAAAPVVSS
ncbi:class II fructose-bisphosphate aldolase [Microbacterium oleivorans]|uniref:Class II fructose-bisphosphate aldolase n=1 Tax=Microbacterium oleivorans TaxID=273677 RepID=A0A7D5JYM5_9MICO|nr:class II fructose-bisphosphate aldolase [Microbacterium oleivorans]QLD11963.1 class II fructose-bisphosphate aldolase [Microbacterium oleivorans]